jgi:hypothetical protein
MSCYCHLTPLILIYLEFIEQSYRYMMLKESFERSIRQAKLQENGELEELSLDELIDELKDNTNA